MGIAAATDTAAAPRTTKSFFMRFGSLYRGFICNVAENLVHASPARGIALDAVDGVASRRDLSEPDLCRELHGHAQARQPQLWARGLQKHGDDVTQRDHTLAAVPELDDQMADLFVQHQR